MKNKLFHSGLILFGFIGLAQNVGINKVNPEQTLHLGSSIGTIRVEGLDKNNNTYNGGLTNPISATYPLYVDSNGVLTLKMDPYTNSDGSDAIDNNSFPLTNLTLLSTDIDGKAETVF